MSNTVPSTSFGAIESRDVVAGNYFSGHTSIAFHQLPDISKQPFPAVCRSIPLPPNEDLVHRSDIATKLNQLLPATSAGYRAAALSGLGGSGKTQIALEYAYDRCRDPACSVFWVDADSKTSFTRDFETIARKLGIPLGLNGEDLLRAVRERIETNPNWVLVLDNADDLGLFGVPQVQRPNSSESKVNLNTFVPQSLTGTGTGTVLWTSRDRHISGSLVSPQRAIIIDQMSPEESETLLDTIKNEKTKEDEYEAAKGLLSELHYLPLAISQAAAYIRRTSTSVENYLEEIQKRKRRWKRLERSEYDRHRREEASNSVLTTWDISVEHLRKGNELTYDVLHCLAFVDNQNIPFEMIREAARLRKQGSGGPNDTEESGSDDDIDDIMEVITRLCEFSFLKDRTPGQTRHEKAYDMHKLVQEAARYRLQRGGDEIQGEAYFAKAAIRITNGLFPRVNWEAWGIVGHREKREQYLPHAQQTAAWAELYGEELELETVSNMICDHLYERGRWKEAEAALTKLLGLHRKSLGDKKTDKMLHTLHALGLVVGRQGRNEEAERMHRQILELRINMLGEKHPCTVESIVKLSKVIYNQGKFEEAEKLCWQAIELGKEVLGEEHRYTLHATANLATSITRQRKYKEAERIYRQTLGRMAKTLGEKDPMTITIIQDFALSLRMQKRLDEAEELSRQAVELGKEVWGELHPGTLFTMSNLAYIWWGQGKHEDAEKMYQQVLEGAIIMLGKEHPNTLKIMKDLSLVFEEQGKFEEAEKMYWEAIELEKGVLGKGHPDLIILAENSESLRWLGKRGDVKDLLGSLSSCQAEGCRLCARLSQYVQRIFER